MPTLEETNNGSYTEPFVQEQYGVFTTTAEGRVKFVGACVSADSALTSATLYYHKMNKHERNNMDMSEIERFFVRVRHLTFTPWDEGSTPAAEAVKKNNPWYGRHWTNEDLG